jgi:hypothetical protein
VVPLLYVLLPAFILANMFRYQPMEAGAGMCIILLGVETYYALGLQHPRARREVGEEALPPTSRTPPEVTVDESRVTSAQ